MLAAWLGAVTMEGLAGSLRVPHHLRRQLHRLDPRPPLPHRDRRGQVRHHPRPLQRCHLRYPHRLRRSGIRSRPYQGARQPDRIPRLGQRHHRHLPGIRIHLRLLRSPTDHHRHQRRRHRHRNHRSRPHPTHRRTYHHDRLHPDRRLHHQHHDHHTPGCRDGQNHLAVHQNNL